MKLLLISGVPATGKTTMGDHLEKHHGFVHLDMEKRSDLILPLRQSVQNGKGQEKVQELIDSFQGQENDSLVITWGFVPGKDDNVVKCLQSEGFKFAWFDGNREAAKRVYERRAKERVKELRWNFKAQMRDWYAQMKRIDEELGLDSFNPVPDVIDTFDGGGESRDKEEIAKELLELL